MPQLISTEIKLSSPTVLIRKDMEGLECDGEAPMKKASFFRIVLDDVLLTPGVLSYQYIGCGTKSDPYICEFIPDDARNPQTWSSLRKWMVSICAALVTFGTTFCSPAYTGAIPGLLTEFKSTETVVTLGLALLILVGTFFALGYTIFGNQGRYMKLSKAARVRGEIGAPPEARLPPGMVGSIALPIGLFWFARTNGPEIHWIVSIIATVPFGFGMIMVFLPLANYMIDSYTIYAASILAGSGILRCLFGFAFPLLTTYMYKSLGIHWASSVPAFLALACVPFPFLFYKYGARIRNKCEYSRKASEEMAKLMQGAK